MDSSSRPWCNLSMRFTFDAQSITQISKAYGAFVVTTCSPESKAFVTSLGADDTVDYRSVQPSLPRYLADTYALSKFDLVIDTIGTDVSSLYAACPQFLKPSGQFLDLAGAAHIHDFRSAWNTGVGLLNRLVRPVFLGGTPRKYNCLLLLAASMVCRNILRYALAFLIVFITENGTKRRSHIVGIRYDLFEPSD
jgi:D-arabinose 1-dehydrogenase-like Zn-dependent alcohol dehydrogenase